MTTFAVWAPNARHEVTLRLPGNLGEHLGQHLAGSPGEHLGNDAREEHRAVAGDGGWWHLDVPDAGHGTDYAFCVDGGPPTADPRSRWQPTGVHGPSRVYDDSRFAWTDGAWRGRDVRGRVVYELHVGTFTARRDFDGVISRLGHLVDLGVEVVEVMPVASFPGRHGWGYDGVHLWSVHEPYGGPDGLKRLVDACHGTGLAVVLDVVYNHLGPSGNHLARFAPYFTDRYQTPWGDAVNLDGPGSDEVRAWIVGNALMWLSAYHLDGLRLDAVHALHDERAVPVLAELSAEVDALASRLGRPTTLIAESDRNDPRTVRPRASGGLGVHAQWDDDVHHALHALLTGERQGYYGDFGSVATVGKALTRGFVHDGTWSRFRGRHHGAPLDAHTTSGHQLVAFLADHDQVGNRAAGDRITASVSPARAIIGTGLLLTSAFTPMLFMGEEWAASTPWQYFTDHTEPELAAAVREGRRAEFASHGWAAADVPDPQDPATLAASTLDWSEPGRGVHARVLACYRALIAARHDEPELADPRLDQVVVDGTNGTDGTGRANGTWLVVRRGHLRVVASWANEPTPVPLDATVTEVLVDTAALLGTGEAVLDGSRVVLPGEGLVIVRVAEAAITLAGEGPPQLS